MLKSIGIWPRVLLVVFCAVGLLSSLVWLGVDELRYQSSKASLTQFGLNTFYVHSVDQSTNRDAPEVAGQVGLSDDQLSELEKPLLGQGAISILMESLTFQGLSYQSQKAEATLIGCDSNLADVCELKVNSGRFLAPADSANGLKVCVISDDVAKNLLPYDDPIGKRIMLLKESYTVVGLLAPQPIVDISGVETFEVSRKTILIPLVAFSDYLKQENSKFRKHLIFKCDNETKYESSTTAVKKLFQSPDFSNRAKLFIPRESLEEKLTAERIDNRKVQAIVSTLAFLMTFSALIFATFAQGPYEALNVNATRGSRLRAAILDLLIGLPLGVIFFWWQGFSWQLESRKVHLLEACLHSTLGFAGYLILNSYPMIRYGQSWGKRLCRIAVVDAKSGLQVPYYQYFLRELCKLLFGFIQSLAPFAPLSLVDVLLILTNHRRCLHDWIASTKVIKTNYKSDVDHV